MTLPGYIQDGLLVAALCVLALGLFLWTAIPVLLCIKLTRLTDACEKATKEMSRLAARSVMHPASPMIFPPEDTAGTEED